MVDEKYYIEAASRIEWCEDKDCWKYTDEFMERASNMLVGRGKYSVGSVNGRGYRYLTLTLNGKRKIVNLSRVVWYKTHGVVPTNFIDHIDGNTDNDRPSNLRDVSCSVNSRNSKKSKSNTSGHVGVDWHKVNSRWTARVCVNGKPKYLGSFKTIEEAIEARKEAQDKLGYFTERHGK